MGPIARRLVVGAAALVALVCAAAGEDRRTDPTRLVVVTSNAEFLEGRRYRTSLVGGRDTYAEQEVCLLTRIDPEGGAIARDDREGCSDSVRKSVSKDDVARIRVGSLELGLVGARLHAEPNREDRRAQREAQADAVRGTARDLRAAGCVPVVLGDFNDHDGVDDARGCVDSTPITNVLVSIRAVDLATPANILWNAAALVPTPLRCTPFWDQDDDRQIDAPRALTSINPVLLSSEVRPMVEVVEFPHSHDPRRVTDRFSSVVRLRIGKPRRRHRRRRRSESSGSRRIRGATRRRTRRRRFGTRLRRRRASSAGGSAISPGRRGRSTGLGRSRPARKRRTAGRTSRWR